MPNFLGNSDRIFVDEMNPPNTLYKNFLENYERTRQLYYYPNQTSNAGSSWTNLEVPPQKASTNNNTSFSSMLTNSTTESHRLLAPSPEPSNGKYGPPSPDKHLSSAKALLETMAIRVIESAKNFQRPPPETDEIDNEIAVKNYENMKKYFDDHVGSSLLNK